MAPPSPPPRTLVVTTASWDASQGSAALYDRGQRVWGPTPIFVGSSGMAWDPAATGLRGDRPGPVKREGDGRAPAGIFVIGATWERKGSRGAFCVDDPASTHYNRIVRVGPKAPKTWRSAERMTMYEHAVVVEYNRARTPGAGSCIFVHASTRATAGCTGVPRAPLAKLLPLLAPGTLMIQLPVREWKRLRWMSLLLGAAS